MAKKRLLFCMSSLRGGGAEKVLIDILEHFDYTRFEVDLCLFFPSGVFLDKVPNAVKVYSLMSKSKWKTRILYKLFFDLPLKIGFNFLTGLYVNLILNNKYDVEIAFMEGLSTKCIALHRTKAKKIAWIHIDLKSNHYTVQWYKSVHEEKQTYNNFQQLIFVSSDAQKAFNEEFENTTSSQQVIYNLIPANNIRKKAKDFIVNDDRFTIVTVGRLEIQKRFDRLIRATLLLKNDGFKFVINIIGSGNLKKELIKLAKELGVTSEINFLGFQNNPYPYIKNADVYVNTSMAEGYPLTVCEATVLGKAMVCTKTAGSMEILENNNYGLLVEHNEQAIYCGLKTIMSDYQLLSHYENRALERARMFNVTIVMNMIYDIF